MKHIWIVPVVISGIVGLYLDAVIGIREPAVYYLLGVAAGSASVWLLGQTRDLL